MLIFSRTLENFLNETDFQKQENTELYLSSSHAKPFCILQNLSQQYSILLDPGSTHVSSMRPTELQGGDRKRRNLLYDTLVGNTKFTWNTGEPMGWEQLGQIMLGGRRQMGSLSPPRPSPHWVVPPHHPVYHQHREAKDIVLFLSVHGCHGTDPKVVVVEGRNFWVLRATIIAKRLTLQSWKSVTSSSTEK